MNKILPVIWISLLFISCERYTPGTREALKLSGSNREQLEKVLQHYSSPADSLKRQAALFLIENMPGHYTLRGDKIDLFRQAIDQDTTCSYYYKKLYEITLDHFITEDKNVRHEEDVEHITADFLIRHIDASFDLAREQKLLDILPFDLFLEHVLPYRFEHERLDLWRDSLQVIFEEKPTGVFSLNFSKLQSYFKLKEDKKYHLDAICNLLKQNPFGDCYFIAYNAMLERRSLGIPVIVDCIPFYSNRNGYHYWCTDPPLVFKESTMPNAFDRRTAKVYRHTYTRNPFLTPDKGEFIPTFFQNPFQQDVTSLYCHTVDIKIKGNIACSTPHAYLCVFNDLQWKPIVAGEVIHGEAEFKQMAKNIVYLPVYYESNGKIVPFNYPFILDTKGDIKFLIPDKANNISLHLERKNPDLMNYLSYHVKNLRGTIVEGSDNNRFSRVDTVFILDETNKLYYEITNLHPDKRYKWYRVKGRPKSFLAELYFINSKNEILQGLTDSLKRPAIDGNPLTNIHLHEDLVIHFDSAVNVKKLVCLPRNDGNGIYPDNVYELFYFEQDGWQSLGIQEGDKFYLEYENVPGNALYWLRNLTTGVEERIFSCIENQVIFW